MQGPILAFFFGWVLLGTGCTPLSVRSDYDLTADFSKYRTYSYMAEPAKGSGASAVPNSAFFDQRLRIAIDKVMAGKGYRMEENDPDFLAVHHVNLKDRRDAYYYGYRYWGPATSYVEEYKEATLTIDFVDPKTNLLFWRGWAAKDVYDSPRNPEEAQKRIDEVVAKILENYPPQ